MGVIGLFDRADLASLRRVMDLSAWRQRTCASNVANAETPDYRRQDVSFADELEKAGGKTLRLSSTHPAHIGTGQRAAQGPQVYEVPVEEGGGPVEIEREMVSLAENQLRFSFAARLSALRIQGLRSSIRGQP